MCALPCLIVGRSAKCLKVQRTTWERKHGYRRTGPHPLGSQMLLPCLNLPAIVFFCKNPFCEHKIGLDPGYPGTGIDQKLIDSPGLHAAVLVEFLATFLCYGFNATLHGNTVGPPQKIQSLFIPKINPGLQADLDGALRNGLQQQAHILPDSKDLVNEVNVLHTARHQDVDLLQHGRNGTLTEFVAKERLVAEGTRPGTAARELQLCAYSVVIGKHVMAVPVGLHTVIVKIKRPEGLHVGNTQLRTYMEPTALLSAKTAALDFAPRHVCQLRERLVRLASQSDVAAGLAHGGRRGC